MPCYKPLKLWYDKRSRQENKKLIVYKVTGQETDLKESDVVGSMDIPCGQCYGCRLDYSREWADRIMLELQLHDPEKCFFVTLTYSPEWINRPDTCLRYITDTSTGECTDRCSHSLNLKNLQDFMKRLRKALEPDKIRFFACGEYGDERGRPHFHLILFNADLRGHGGLEPYKQNFNGDQYYTSPLLEKVWPYGFNVVAKVTWKDAAYVARYMMKKAKGADSKVYEELNLKPPFTVMSRVPGIAHDYYKGDEEKGLDPHKRAVYNKTYIGTEDGSVTICPPRYFKKLLYYEDPEEWLQLSEENKKKAIEREKIIMSQTTMSKTEYLENLYKNVQQASEILNSYRNKV